jgi:hypothetical protein
VPMRARMDHFLRRPRGQNMITIHEIVAAAPGWKAMVYCAGGKSIKDSYLLEGIACWALVKSGERTCVQGVNDPGLKSGACRRRLRQAHVD